MDSIYAVVGAEIRKRREATGTPQAAIAARLGLSRTSVTNIEAGRQPISILHLYEIAEMLAVAVTDLLPASRTSTRPARRRGNHEMRSLLVKLDPANPAEI